MLRYVITYVIRHCTILNETLYAVYMFLYVEFTSTSVVHVNEGSCDTLVCQVDLSALRFLVLAARVHLLEERLNRNIK